MRGEWGGEGEGSLHVRLARATFESCSLRRSPHLSKHEKTYQENIYPPSPIAGSPLLFFDQHRPTGTDRLTARDGRQQIRRRLRDSRPSLSADTYEPPAERSYERTHD